MKVKAHHVVLGLAAVAGGVFVYRKVKSSPKDTVNKPAESTSGVLWGVVDYVKDPVVAAATGKAPTQDDIANMPSIEGYFKV